MIYLFSGTPGSGKSLHAARDIYNRLCSRKYPNCICNFPVNLKAIKRLNDNHMFTYVENKDLTPDYLRWYASTYHKLGIENQTLLVVDEAQIVWNSREWQSNVNRLDWISFFTQHRKLGFNIILISQNDRMLDRQIRCNIEYEVKHRKVNNFKFFRFIPFKVFVAVSYWYGLNERLDSEFFRFRQKYADIYNSFDLFK